MKPATRRSALRAIGLAAMAPAAAAAASPAVSAVDPVFALIEANRAAVLESDAAFDVKAPSDETRERLAQDREWDALLTLLETMPTTPAGVAAVLAYVGSRCRACEQILLWEAHGTSHKHLPDVAEAYLVRLGAALAGMTAA